MEPAFSPRSSSSCCSMGSSSLSFACQRWFLSKMSLSTRFSFPRHCSTRSSCAGGRGRPISAPAPGPLDWRTEGEVFTATCRVSMRAFLYSCHSVRSTSACSTSTRRPSESRKRTASSLSVSAMWSRKEATSRCVSASKTVSTPLSSCKALMGIWSGPVGAGSPSGRTCLERAPAPPAGASPVRRGGALSVQKALASTRKLLPEGLRLRPTGSGSSSPGSATALRSKPSHRSSWNVCWSDSSVALDTLNFRSSPRAAWAPEPPLASPGS
mmetsp:Transcript_91532/g.243141  ORF Transcript_91532/g.243141 Transcript_91532/m.243141 type:complete len:269 (+) Transcript_91532:126-932(+)